MKVRRGAFTLVEVILAILIISAIITVLLYFYQRSVEVRQAVLREAEYLSVSRMFLEQLTGELRTARVVDDQFIGFEGTSNSISFVCTGIPLSSRWIINTNEAASLAPGSDLKRVTYRLLTGTNALDIRGIDRIEELLTAGAFTAGTNSTEFVSTNAVSDSETNLVTTNEVELIRQPLTAQIKFLQFRFWAGTNWVESWNGLELPGGVEISVGRDPMVLEAAPAPTETSGSAEEYSAEFFRRIVYLPNSTPRANQVLREAPADLF